MVLAHLFGLVLSAGSGPRSPLELIFLAAVLGPTAVFAKYRSLWMVLPFAILAAIGVTLGLLRVPMPLSSLITIGTLLVLGAALAANRPMSARWAAALGAIAVSGHAWATTQALVENVSRSTATAAGAALVAIFVFYVGLVVARDLRVAELPVSMRLLGAVVATLAVFWRVGEYQEWFEREVATDAALGLARLPLLALALVALALVLWIRHRRAAREVGSREQLLGAHWFALGGAFLLLPFGTLVVPNPFFASYAPRGEGARLVMSRVLSDTYQALNIEDESELYDTLEESVTGDLVDDLYLDNRRRLTSGMRAGTEITIRGVNVLEIGEPGEGMTGERGYSYDCRWAVVARVQHLQHVHHRRNVFNGVLTLRADKGRWKISGVELHSEEREVVPWEPT
jgi:hydrogenase/urease accessory protein HupE